MSSSETSPNQGRHELDGLPEMRLRPLTRTEARALLDATAPGPIDESVAERVLAESRGNPGAIAAAFDGVTAAELAGGFGIPAPRRGRSCAPGHDCPDRVRRLPPAARRLLLAAAADPTGDATLLRSVATDAGAVRLLAAQRLLVVGDLVTFVCPGLRSVAYFAATPGERREVHRMLAEGTQDDPPRRAWHLGMAAAGPDDALADRLEECAGQAESRAAFLQMAALLTGDPSRRAARALTAAAAKHEAGDLGAAQRLLAIAEAGPADPVRLARAAWHRARIEMIARSGPGSVRQLLDAAVELGRREPAAGREAHLEALLAAMSAGEPAAIEAARAAGAATEAHRPHPVDQILYGLAARVLDGYAGSVVPLRTAITLFRRSAPDPRTIRWAGLAALLAADLWDERACRALARQYKTAPVDWQGRSDRPASHDGSATAVAVAVLRNASGHYDEAVEAAREASRAEHPGLTGWALMELVEAAARSGRPETAADAAARLAERTSAAGTDWALGAQATAQALLVEGEQAEPRYREAVERLARAGIRGRLARAQLLYGEWLRRRNRRVDARAQLRAARDLFTELGAGAFADRAHRELLATGEAARKRTVDCGRQLTPQETRVAGLARDGLSNPEIAARLYVSTRTVEYHLHKVFTKLAIASRAKLHLVLDAEPPPR